MSELRLDHWTMPTGGWGRPDPLPELFSGDASHGPQTELESSFDDEQARYVQYGHVPGCLPYHRWYGYSRERAPGRHRTAVLENDLLRATFLLDLGGRLWSLFHKPTGTELLYTNPVLQPANLGTVHMWFSGGVEWNCGIRGHTPLTCSPMWAAAVTGTNGEPILRLYEFERVRRIAYQMDFSLPDGSPCLLARMRIVNPHDSEVPMYWWSNIAARETEGGRVVVPATSSILFRYDGSVRRRGIPVHEGHDLTYPTRPAPAADSFYEVAELERPWISSLDSRGRGPAQISTPRLRGRKLFRWGGRPGGRQWQQWLSPGGPPYIEIQAGLALTQAQALPMPPGAEWSWLEAYTRIETDPETVHGKDWQAAVREVRDRLDEVFTAEELAERLEATAADALRPPDAVLHRGSGWGTLERRRRRADGERPFCSDALVFDDESLGDAQTPWLELLETGALPEADPAAEPGVWMVQPEWRDRLQRSIDAGDSDHWTGRLHLGVMACYHGDTDAAKAEWEASIEETPSAWAYRNLAVLAEHEERLDEAADRMQRAVELRPDLPTLAVESFDALIRAGRAREVLDAIPTMPEPVREYPRMRVLEARAALAAGELDRARALIEDPFEVPDIREGERSLSDIWFELQEKRLAAREGVPIDEELRQRVRKDYPPPPHLEFRMFA